MSERDKLFKKIQVYAFILVELNLYLDSHPTCKHGLAHHAKYLKLYKEALEEYESKFGMLTANTETDGKEFTWATTPWPWERGE